MAQVYYASITDHNNEEVLNLEYTGSAKHSAKLAQLYVASCPPAIAFNIHKMFIDNKQAAFMLNRERH